MASWTGLQPRPLPNPRRGSVRGLPAIPVFKQAKEQNRLTDFWIPQVTQDGQIYYANTLTGQHSRDLPAEPEEDVADPALVLLTTSQSSVRSRTGAELGLAVATPIDINTASVGESTQTVQPSTSRRLLPDSQAMASAPVTPTPPFINPNAPHTRTRAKTEASTSTNRHSNRVPGVLFDTLTAQYRQWNYRNSLSRSSNHSRSKSSSTPNVSSSHGSGSPARKGSHLKESSTALDEQESMESTPKLPPSKIIFQDPSLLSPSSPELVPELLEHARHCINAVIIHLQQFGIPQSPDDEEIIDDLINIAVTAIRELLYVAGPSFGHLTDRKGHRTSTSHAAQTHLIPAQRRTIATLSKFVLSARAVLNDGAWEPGNGTFHLGLDAEELERSVIDFVSIAQGVFREFHGDKGQKRLYGYLSAPDSGLGKPGGGAAGIWKGFGWVSIDGNEEAPRRSLDTVTFHEFVAHASRIQQMLKHFSGALQASQPAKIVTKAGKATVYELSSLLEFLGDIHIARHVDIESVNQHKLPDGVEYSRTVDRARVLVRSFEAATQALYDDSASLLTTIQSIQRMELCESWRGRDKLYDTLEALSLSVNFNLQTTRQKLESLLSVGQEQTNILKRFDKSPLEWRMSQRSLVAAILADEALNDVTNGQSLYREMRESEKASDVDSDQQEKSEELPVLAPLPNEKSIPVVHKDPGAWTSVDDEDLGLMRTPPRQDKIKAFFGDEAPSHYLISHSTETKPWYLRPNYDPAEVLIDPDGTVRGGTILALVERLTAHEYADPKFSKAFLMTFRSFVTLEELFKLLVDRFWIQPPPNLDADELADWRKFKQYIIRMRVINTLKSMVQDQDVLEKEELGILDRISQFVSQDEVVGIPAARQLLIYIKRVERGRDHRKITVNTSVDPPPPPIVPRRLELLDIDPLELARQLTITESQLYQKIRPSECMQRSKQSQQTKTDPRDGVANFIRRSNRIAQWVTYSVLCKDDPRRRAAVMKQFIVVADRCRTIQNFSTMGAIVSGLNSAPIHRLKRSWELVSSRYMSQLETCEAIINSYRNYNNFRSTLATVSPPCVPFVGVFLTALTHIQDGSKDYLPGNLINFRKRQKTSEVIQDLQRWQTQPHNFHPLPSVLVHIDESLRQFGDQDVSDVFWQLSMEREPREREDEKLARILHESGFF
ncbi:hypothetical protein ID866_2231 [Astraeus odoratus]|nr:hypothetical protein ID866_2231 [Astraeus odoratus]